jgi:hypothetical protein
VHQKGRAESNKTIDTFLSISVVVCLLAGIVTIIYTTLLVALCRSMRCAYSNGRIIKTEMGEKKKRKRISP